MPKYDSLRDEAKQWHRVMGQYLADIDWAGHIVHTNFKTANGDPTLGRQITRRQAHDPDATHSPQRRREAVEAANAP